MPTVESEFALSRDPRLAAQLADHATGVLPAWLWSADGSRILWANAVGAALFGAASTKACTDRRFAPAHPAAAEIARLGQTLTPSTPARLERLRGFGASFGRPLTCLCSRPALADGRAAIMIIATEAVGPALPLAERVARLFAGGDGAVAVFAADGTFLHASEAALRRFSDVPTLAALGLTELAKQALATGSASGVSPDGPVTMQRLGGDASPVLAATFAAPARETRHDAGAPNTVVAVSTVSAADAQPSVPAVVPPAEAQPAAVAPAGGEPVHPALPEEPLAERRHPLRFVWQMDADGRFALGSDEFVKLIGPRTTAAFGRLWSEIAAELNLDPDGRVARALATRETWSGITVFWPVDEGGQSLAVELSGLPVFDRDRGFRGYRGFGVCRDLELINQLARARREHPIGFMTRPEAIRDRGETAAATPEAASRAPAPQAATPAEVATSAPKPEMPPPASEAVTPVEAEPSSPPAAERASETSPAQEAQSPAPPPAANVVPFRSGAASEPKAPSLSPVERKAFRELAQELTARLGGVRETADVASDAEHGAVAAQDQTPVTGAVVEPAKPAAADDARSYESRETVGPPPKSVPETILLDRLPVGVLIYQQDALLYANRHFFELTGYADLDTLTAAGGLAALFAETGGGALDQAGDARPFAVRTKAGERRTVDGRLFSVPWGGATALALVLVNGGAEERRRNGALALSDAENEIRELKARLDSYHKTEEELRAATREAQKAAAVKADFLSKVSHEIRTPLNTITGFTEVIMAERFGPIGNERYREYLQDVYAAGMHLVSLLNDLLDLSKIESGQLDLNFANVSLNDLTKQCVGIMQPQASRGRIIIRTALAPALPQVVADERSLRQIVLNLLSNSIRFTGPGGQVIVSTAFADSGEAVLRVRDTGVGMSEKDVEAALEPFRQTATSGSWGSGGTGLGLPLTKALAEANRAHFSIKSAPNAGTLVEVAFPPARVVAH